MRTAEIYTKLMNLNIVTASGHQKFWPFTKFSLKMSWETASTKEKTQ